MLRLNEVGSPLTQSPLATPEVFEIQLMAARQRTRKGITALRH